MARDALSMPMHRDVGRVVAERRRAGQAFGGPVIWRMEEAWMPSPCTCEWADRKDCKRHARSDELRARVQGTDAEDRGGIFGQYPRGWLDTVFRSRLLGPVSPLEVLHVCSGALRERWTVDVRPGATPAVVADGAHLPFRAASFPAVMIDPPYTEDYARNLYGTDYPRPSWLLREAARVVQPCGRIGMLHFSVPSPPPRCRLVNVWGVTTGVGYRIRAFTVYEREQDDLFRHEEADRG